MSWVLLHTIKFTVKKNQVIGRKTRNLQWNVHDVSKACCSQSPINELKIKDECTFAVDEDVRKYFKMWNQVQFRWRLIVKWKSTVSLINHFVIVYSMGWTEYIFTRIATFNRIAVVLQSETSEQSLSKTRDFKITIIFKLKDNFISCLKIIVNAFVFMK